MASILHVLFACVCSLVIGHCAAEREQAPKKVNLFLISGAGCPPCRVQILGALNNMLQRKGLADIVEFGHDPFGNSYYATKDCGGAPYNPGARHCWAKKCVDSPGERPADCFNGTLVNQHGDEEGLATRTQACALMVAPHWKKYWSFLVCFEKNYEKGKEAAEGCAKDAKLNYGKISKCSGGKVGEQLVQHLAQSTFDHLGTPMLFINNVFFNLEDAKGNPLPDERVLGAVCAAYPGPKPEGCEMKADAAGGDSKNHSLSSTTSKPAADSNETGCSTTTVAKSEKAEKKASASSKTASFLALREREVDPEEEEVLEQQEALFDKPCPW